LFNMANKHRRPYFSFAFALAFLFLSAHMNAQTLSFTSSPEAIATVTLGQERGSAVAAVLNTGKASYHYLENVLDERDKVRPSVNRELAASGQPMYEIGSITKVFTGLLLAQAVERGDLSLDDELGVLLKSELAIDSLAVAKITLKQLITHQSCLPRAPPSVSEAQAYKTDPYANYTRHKLWSDLKSLTLEEKTVCPYAYSNFGLGLVGEVLSVRYRKPWSQLVKESITGPLGMSDTLLIQGDTSPRLAQVYNHFEKTSAWAFDALAAAGGLVSTATDMMVFSRALMAGKSGPLGGAADRLLIPLAKLPFGEIGYAVNMVGPPGRRTYWHDGATMYRSLWMMAPDTQQAVVVLASSSHAMTNRAQIRLLASRFPVRDATYRVDEKLLPDYAGVYKLDDGLVVNVVLHEGVLYRRTMHAAMRALKPTGPDVFIDPEYALQYTFVREQGRVSGAQVLHLETRRNAIKTSETSNESVLTSQLESQYTGVYERKRNQKRELYFDVRSESGQLAVRSLNWPRAYVYPVAGKPDRFYYEAVKAELQFERSSSGEVTGVTLVENGVHKMERVSE
jgi:serine-type D-Ala-D-Ala carboxypeptidase/endopeptidase